MRSSWAGDRHITPDITISTEGAGRFASGTAFDKAGNSASTTVSGINIDKTAPVITITSPMAAKYDHSAVINISFSTTDDVSGVHKTTVYLIGTHTLKVESKNYAGLIAAQSVDFEVIATAGSTTSEDYTSLKPLIQEGFCVLWGR